MATAPDTTVPDTNRTLVTTPLNNFDIPRFDDVIPATDTVVWVTATADPHDIHAELLSIAQPDHIDVIALGHPDPGYRGPTLAVHPLAADTGIDALGTQLFDCLDTIDATNHDPVIVIDNLYDIVTNTSLQTMYSFLHLVTIHARSNDWPVKVGLDPHLLDPTIPTILATLFDTIE